MAVCAPPTLNSVSSLSPVPGESESKTVGQRVGPLCRPPCSSFTRMALIAPSVCSTFSSLWVMEQYHVSENPSDPTASGLFESPLAFWWFFSCSIDDWVRLIILILFLRAFLLRPVSGVKDGFWIFFVSPPQCPLLLVFDFIRENSAIWSPFLHLRWFKRKQSLHISL